jgi:hypothetical protein
MRDRAGGKKKYLLFCVRRRERREMRDRAGGKKQYHLSCARSSHFFLLDCTRVSDQHGLLSSHYSLRFCLSD